MRHLLLVLFLVSATLVASAQMNDELTAYEPPVEERYAMDDRSIALAGRIDEGTIAITLPKGTEHLDILNARGRVVCDRSGADMYRLDLSELRPGTYMIRAYVGKHIERKRIVVMRPGAGLWAVDANTP